MRLTQPEVTIFEREDHDITKVKPGARVEAGSDTESISRLSATSSWSPFAHKRGIRRYLGPKRVLVGGLYASLIGLAWYLREHGELDLERLVAFISAYPLTAPGLFIAAYALLVLLMIPTLPLNLAAGILWGPLWGGLLATAGSGLGAIGAFVISRTILGQLLAHRLDNRMVTWLQDELETKGWRVVAFTRINPVFPSSPLNFLFGLTSIRLSTYTWSTVAFLFPPTLAFAVIGHEAGKFVLKGETADLIRTILIVSGVIVLLVMARVATKAIFHDKRKPAL